jgi:hypothetical protein
MTVVPETTGTVAESDVSAKAERVREHWRGLATVQANDNNDAQEIADRQVVAIMSAETEDEIWDADTGTAIQMRDAVGLEAEFREFRFLLGNDPGKATRSGTYITCDAVTLGGPAELLRKLGTAPGQEIVLQTGAELIVTKLLAFQHRNLLPVRAVVSGTETRSGNMVLRLTRPPVRTTQA